MQQQKMDQRWCGNHWTYTLAGFEDEGRRLKTKKCRQILEAGKSTEIECPPKVLSFPGDSEVIASACNAGDLGSIPGLGRSPGEGNGNPLHYSCLENPMDRGAWWDILHGVAKSRTRLSDFTSLLKSPERNTFYLNLDFCPVTTEL